MYAVNVGEVPEIQLARETIDDDDLPPPSYEDTFGVEIEENMHNNTSHEQIAPTVNDDNGPESCSPNVRDGDYDTKGSWKQMEEGFLYASKYVLASESTVFKVFFFIPAIIFDFIMMLLAFAMVLVAIVLLIVWAILRE